MFRYFIVFLLLGAFATASARENTEADKGQIIRLEQRWLSAIKTGDRRALDPILADEFIDVNTQGEIQNKADVIAYSNVPAHTTQSIKQMKVRIWGDTAVAIGVNEVHPNDKGWTIDVLFTDAFAHLNGHWRAVSAQETLRKPQNVSR